MAVIKNKLEYRPDGSVVLYRRDGRNIWYARFRLPDGKWHRLSTKHTDLKYAAELAGRNKMISALERLRKQSQASVLPKQIAAFGISGGGAFSKLFSSHPSLEERIAALR